MNPETKNQVIKRLKRARGHLTKVIAMVDEGAYCPDVLLQSSAVQSALKKSDEVVLRSHLHSCVVPKLGGKMDENTLNELVQVFSKR